MHIAVTSMPTGIMTPATIATRLPWRTAVKPPLATKTIAEMPKMAQPRARSRNTISYYWTSYTPGCASRTQRLLLRIKGLYGLRRCTEIPFENVLDVRYVELHQQPHDHPNVVRAVELSLAYGVTMRIGGVPDDEAARRVAALVGRTLERREEVGVAWPSRDWPR